MEDINKESSYPKFNFNNDWCVTENGLSLQFTDKKQIATLIYQMPSKTYYKIGEELDVSDMLVMTCDNYGDWRITDDFTVSGFTGALGKNTVTITAGDCSASFNVYVQDYITNSKITLNATKFTATGKAIKPTVKVISKDGRVLKVNTDYTLSYSSNTYPGTGYVTITGKGMYIGSVKKSFIIIPAQVKSLKVSTRKTTSLKLSWTKQSGVTGYEVQKYDSSKKAWKTYKTITSNTNSVTVSKLTPSTVYKFRVRSYKTISGKKYYGSYSSTLTTPTTPSTVKVKSSITYQHHSSSKFSMSWSKCSNVTGYQIQGYVYDYNSDKNVWTNLVYVKGASKTSYKSKWAVHKNFDGIQKLRIRAYKEVNGKKYYGAWTTPKTKHK
ncbi:MAG: fibronectin type III domain-containing protein [Eubacterium sp.]